jgi:hypothetical protein
VTSLDCVIQYYLRAPALDGVSFLDLFKNYTVEWAKPADLKLYGPGPTRQDWDHLQELHAQRPDGSLRPGARWESENLRSPEKDALKGVKPQAA